GHSGSKALKWLDARKDGLVRRNADNLRRIDATDRKIIGELTTDGRVSLAELGRRVDLSSPAVAERVQRLERGGVVVGSRAATRRSTATSSARSLPLFR